MPTTPSDHQDWTIRLYEPGDTRTMRICYTLLYYNPAYTEPDAYLQIAGIMRHLPQALARLGHEVSVVILFPTDHVFEEHGVRYHFVRSNVALRFFSRLAGRWLGRQPAAFEPAFHALRQLRNLQPDLIHFHGAHLYLNHALLLALSGRKRPPIVLHYHGGEPSPNRLARRLQRFNFQRMARFLFTTPAHAQPFVEAGLIDEPRRVVALMQTSNAFRPQARAEARRHTGMTGNPVFLWAGRLDANKDPVTVLRGFEQILPARPHAHLYMYYLEDDLLPDLRSYVAARPSLQERVHFQGRAPFDRMEAIHNSADFLLQASHHEFSGQAVLEAMACGVIPVVTDIPSFRAMTDEGRTGVLFPPGDADALARGVLAISPDEIPERSRQVRAGFERALSFPALARQLDGIYRAVLEESSVIRHRSSVRSVTDDQ